MGKEKILIVEQTKATASDLEECLTRLGYEVVAALTCGLAAVERARLTRPDLLLINVELEGDWDGVTTAEKICALADIPVIYIKSHPDSFSCEGGQKVGAYNFLLKPVQEHELDVAIQSTLYRFSLEQKVKQSEKQYQLLFDNNPLPMWVYDQETLQFLAVNQAATKEYGYSQEEFLQMTVRNICPSTDISALLEAIQKEEDADQPGRATLWQHIKKDGSLLFVEIAAHYQVFQGRKAHLVLSKNVTEQVLSQRLISDKKELLEKLAKNVLLDDVLKELCLRIESYMPEAYCYICFMNASRESLYIKAAPSLPENYTKVLGKFAIGPQAGSCGTAAYKGESVVVEDILTDPLWEQFRSAVISFGLRSCWSSPIFDKDNKVIATFAIYYKRPHLPTEFEQSLVKIACNLTSIGIERERIYEEFKEKNCVLADSATYYRNLLQFSTDLIKVVDMEGTILYESPAIKPLLGYEEKELLGKNVFSFVHPEDREKAYRYFEQTIQNSNVISVITIRCLHKDGSYRILEAQGKNITTNALSGVVINSRDVTDRKMQEQRLRLLQRAIDSSKNGVLLIDNSPPDYPIIYANKAVKQITGFELAEVINSKYHFLRGEASNKLEADTLSKAIKEGKECEVVIKNYRKDGSEFWNNISVSPVQGADGEVTHFVGILNDITSRKYSEDVLKNIVQNVSGAIGESFFKALVENLAKSLQTDFSWIGVVDENKPNLVHTLAFYATGQISDDFDYYSENLLVASDDGATDISYYPENVAALFPEIPFFAKEQISTYMGIVLRNSAGKALGILSVMGRRPFINVDIAASILKILSVRAAGELERLENIEALTRSEQRFRRLTESSPDIIYIIALSNRRILYVNREKIFGYTAAELTSTSAFFDNLIHEDDWLRIQAYRKGAVSAEAPDTNQIEYRIRSKDEKWDWVNSRYVVMEREPDGVPKYLLINLTIITQKKEVQEALEESKANLQGLIENTKDGIWAINREFKIIALNTSIKYRHKKMFGFDLAIGDNILTKVPEKIVPYWLSVYERAFSGERFTEEVNYFIEGRDIDFEVSFNPIYGENGRIDGASVFARDITKRKKAEKELLKTNFELDSFVYRASHDLRAPLRSVLGLVNILRVEENKDQREVYLKLVEKSINKLDTFIADLTNFSRNSRLSLNVEEINFESIINDCRENLQFMEHADKVVVKITIESKAPFYSDASRISIILQNLLSNAIKYRNPYTDSFVDISIVYDSQRAHIIVSDNGRGIEEAHIDKVFDMFFRASQVSYGSGLGLYITRQVVEKLNGSITIASQMGKGTQFTIILPNLSFE